MSTTTGITTGTNAASLSDCVTALRTSLSYLESSVNTLGDGISDFPRLMNVLRTTRHYELIPQSTLQAAEASLRSELAPAIETLLDRADSHIDRTERRIESLKARSELQQGRLDNYTTTPSSFSATTTNSSRNSKKMLDEKAKARARALKQDREALQYSIERLELQVLQKERELRKRLDANT